MSTSRQNRKSEDRKVRGRNVSKPVGDFQSDDIGAAQVPFYTLDPSTQHLEPLAQTALRVEQVKNSYDCSNYSEKTSDTGELSWVVIPEIERVANVLWPDGSPGHVILRKGLQKSLPSRVDQFSLLSIGPWDRWTAPNGR